MRLEDARQAKESLARSFGLYTPRVRRMPGIQLDMLEQYRFEPDERPSIALGVSDIDGEFVPAVRVQDRKFWTPGFRSEIKHVVGDDVDIEYIGELRKFAGSIRPLRPGSSIGNSRRTIGTLGAFVLRDGAPMILSNNHVLADEDRAPIGEPIFQPALGDGGATADRVGSLKWALPLQRSAINRFDVALASVDPDQAQDPRPNGVTLRGVRPYDPADASGVQVAKVARTTGYTEGFVRTFDLDNVQVRYDLGRLRFDDQLEIRSSNGAFSRPGDSGALVFSLADREAVALIFAGKTSGRFLTYAHPLEPLLDRLGAQLIT